MTQTIAQLWASAEGKAQTMKALLDKGPAITQEDMAQIHTLQAEVETIRGQIDEAKKLDAVRAQNERFLAESKQAAFPVPHPTPTAPGAARVEGFTPAGETTVETNAKGSRLWQDGECLISEKQWNAVHQTGYTEAFGAYLRKGLNGLSGAELKVLNEGIDASGGFLAPEEILSRLVEKRPTPTRVAGMVTRLTTGRDSMVMPRVVWTTDDIYTTGIRATFTGEIPASSTTHRVTEPVFGTFRVGVYTAMLSMPITRDMMEDALFPILPWSSAKFSETIDLLYDNMVLNGTGVGQPAGILQNPNGTDEPATVGSAATAAPWVAGDDIWELAYSVPEQYDESCRFVFNKTSTARQLHEMKDKNDRYLFGSGYQDSGLANARPTNLAGYPYVYSGFMPNAAQGITNYPIIFGDLAGYFLVERVGLSLQVLNELYAETNQVLLLGRLRFGGDVAEPWRMKILACHS